MHVKVRSVNRLLVLLIGLWVSIPLSGCGPTRAELDAPATEVAATQTAAAPRPTPIPVASLRSLFDYDPEKDEIIAEATSWRY